MHLVRQILEHFGCDFNLLFFGDWLGLGFGTLIIAIVVSYLAWWHTFLDSSLHSYRHVVKLAVVQFSWLRFSLVEADFFINKRNIGGVIFLRFLMTITKVRVDLIPFFRYYVFVKIFWISYAFRNWCNRVFFLCLWLRLLFLLFMTLLFWLELKALIFMLWINLLNFRIIIDLTKVLSLFNRIYIFNFRITFVFISVLLVLIQ